MKATFENGKKLRSITGGILGGWLVYICRDVAGKNAPSTKEFALMIDATGAILLRHLVDVPSPNKTIVITSDPIKKGQRSVEGVENFMCQGARMFTTSWLFRTIITLQLCLEDDEQSAPAPERNKQKSSLGSGISRKSNRKHVRLLIRIPNVSIISRFKQTHYQTSVFRVAV